MATVFYSPLPAIESVFWHGLPGLNTITMNDGLGGGDAVLTLPSAMTVTDAIQEWQDQANAHANLVSTDFIFEADTAAIGGVEFSDDSGGGSNFTITFGGSLPAALGYVSTPLSGAAVYNNTIVPMAFAQPFNIDYDGPLTDSEVQLRLYRWGRVVSHRHNRATLSKIRIDMLTSEADALLEGPLLTSRFRAFPYKGDTTAAYPNGAAFDGYLDCDPYGFVSRPRSFGVGDSHTSIELAVVVL